MALICDPSKRKVLFTFPYPFFFFFLLSFSPFLSFQQKKKTRWFAQHVSTSIVSTAEGPITKIQSAPLSLKAIVMILMLLFIRFVSFSFLSLCFSFFWNNTGSISKTKNQKRNHVQIVLCNQKKLKAVIICIVLLARLRLLWIFFLFTLLFLLWLYLLVNMKYHQTN